MKTIKPCLLIFLLILICTSAAYSQNDIIPRGWGGSYSDNMRFIDGTKNYENDIYVYFIRRIDNVFADKGSDYNTIKATTYSDIWIGNINRHLFAPSDIMLNDVAYTYESPVSTNFQHYIYPQGINGSFDPGTLNLVLGVPGGEKQQISLAGMTFPEYYMIAGAPDMVSVKSGQDFTIQVANAKQVATSGFALAQPDELSLYFYTAKGEKRNAFKTPVSPVPGVGGTWFAFTYPGANIKSDYEASYFDLGEQAVVVKSVKSYPLNLTIKNFEGNFKVLVTFVTVAEKPYVYMP